MSTAPRIGLVTCARDEERFMEPFLRWHERMGVSRGYVFLDRCSDRTEEIARSFPWVTVISVPSKIGEKCEYVRSLQKHCCAEALGLARRDGIDWLLLVDPDEFAYGRCISPRIGWDARQRAGVVEGDLRTLCADIAPDVEMIVLKTKEVVPRRSESDLLFWQQSYFQVARPVRRRIPDPCDPDVRSWVSWLGHNIGKSLVRVRDDVRARGSHFWHVEEAGELREPRRVNRGSCYHFHLTGSAHFREKFAKLAHEPDVWWDGMPVPFTKRVWKRAAGRLAPEEIERYLQRHVFRQEGELAWRARLGQITFERVLEDVLGQP